MNIITLIWHEGKCKTYNFDDKIYEFNSQRNLELNLKRKFKTLDRKFKSNGEIDDK